MSRIITVTSGKGGVGKSSISVNLAIALAHQNLKVCLIDGDFGLKNLDVMMGLENRVVYDLNDVISGKCEIHQVLVKDKREQTLYLLPACKTLSFQNLDASIMAALIDYLKNDVGVDNEITQVVDPTLLLESQWYINIFSLKKKKKEKYIFVYILEDRENMNQIINMTIKTSQKIGLKIKKLRENMELSQSQLAEMVGYKDKTSIAKIEAGKVDFKKIFPFLFISQDSLRLTSCTRGIRHMST